MAKLTRLDAVGIYTRNQKVSEEFYTRKIGLKVRTSDPKFGYVQLGATKGYRVLGISSALTLPLVSFSRNSGSFW